jgi:hypothetical protein
VAQEPKEEQALKDRWEVKEFKEPLECKELREWQALKVQ